MEEKPQSEDNIHTPDDLLIKRETIKHWVFEKNEMVFREISFNPALYEVFDKILLHAALRHKRDVFKVSIDPGGKVISVYYTGEPNAGDLLLADFTDSNKFVNEVNHSTEFFVEYAASGSRKKFKMEVEKNMVSKHVPSVTNCKIDEDWTMVSFRPDLEKFKMPHLEKDIVALMKRRVLDIAYFLGKTVKVELNCTKILLQSFRDYAELHLRDTEKSKLIPLPRVHATVGERMEICVSLSDGNFQQVSFVNGTPTVLGGTHVDCIVNQVADRIARTFENLDANFVKNHLWVFVSARIDHPTFESGSKTQQKLTTKTFELEPIKESTLCKVEKRIGRAIHRRPSLDEMELGKEVEKKEIKKFKKFIKFRKMKQIDDEFLNANPTFLDALEAGGEFSQQCTLIIVEGQSPQSFAEKGLQLIGQKYYGVYGLTGKPANPKKNLTKALRSDVVNNIMNILGVDITRQYNSTEGLRYGHLMIMADADSDGSHIKGLVMNLFHSLCHSLLKVPGFLQESITPVLQASHLKENDKLISFYSVEEFQKWVKSVGNTREWKMYYFKGLASIPTATANEFFIEKFAEQTKLFYWDCDSDDDAINMAFSQEDAHITRRKSAISGKITRRDLRHRHIRYKKFVKTDFLAYCRVNLRRHIPSLVDGFIPSQRKIVHTALRLLFKQPELISNFLTYVSTSTFYRHCSENLYGVLYGMLQDFVGAGNNLTLIEAVGNVGNRKKGCEACPAYRYIWVTLPDVTRRVFHVDDDDLLNNLEFAHHKIEPDWFLPIIPLILVNGCKGIGSGWSSNVPTYHPREIVENIKCLIRNENMRPMTPWVKGFKGTITNAETEGSYIVRGVVSQTGDKLCQITELPTNWDSIDEYLVHLRSKNYLIKSATLDADGDSLDSDNFKITVETSQDISLLDLDQTLDLTHIISTHNMHLLNARGDIMKFNTPEKILTEFYELRKRYYSKRKILLLKKLDAELTLLVNKLNFAAYLLDTISQGNSLIVTLDLMKQFYTPMSSGGKEIVQDIESATMEHYSYLKNIDVVHLTEAGHQILYVAIIEKIRQIQNLQEIESTSLWLADLKELEKHLPALEENV